MTQETITFLKTEVLPEIRAIREGMNDLKHVPATLDSVDENTKEIMADLAISRNKLADAQAEYNKAFIKLANRLMFFGFIIALLCIAGYFGRDITLSTGQKKVTFTQSQTKTVEEAQPNFTPTPQEKPE